MCFTEVATLERIKADEMFDTWTKHPCKVAFGHRVDTELSRVFRPPDSLERREPGINNIPYPTCNFSSPCPTLPSPPPQATPLLKTVHSHQDLLSSPTIWPQCLTVRPSSIPYLKSHSVTPVSTPTSLPQASASLYSHTKASSRFCLVETLEKNNYCNNSNN